MNPEMIGRVIEMKKHKHFVYLICEQDMIYSLICHDLKNDISDILLRVSDLEYVEFRLKEEMKSNGR